MTMPEDDLAFGTSEADCQACEAFGAVDDLGLCAECSAMLDRDMIRQRAWEYSATAFCCTEPDTKRQTLVAIR